ncbi:MAG TPA: tRNA (adenosine(37)-N6)-threonylcarbamoyltransferase complex ATPase subunit type 1 TsaE [Flavobacteriales bacterium]|nr:tRNA (adenosine(37)-N6)-threonylcarbamoyltransferase complex ATPase subunit type 1 TsaE [Flavobacteriales bacterium]
MLATITLRKPEEAEDIARLILQSHDTARVFALHGDLGAGKTTLIKAFCKALGVADRTSSPSFAIVNEYRTGTGDPLYHFDLYRLKATEELDGIGFDEYLDSGAYCFIEWPELAEGHLPPEALHVRIEVSASGVRTLLLG